MHVSIICKIKLVGKIERLENKVKGVSKKVQNKSVKRGRIKDFLNTKRNKVNGEISRVSNITKVTYRNVFQMLNILTQFSQ